MCTEDSEPVALFLFAHQDDEYGVFRMIEKELDQGRGVWCIYFTDGGALTLRRNLESIAVLTDMGVLPSNIQFVGKELGVKDGDLMSSLNVCASKLREIFLSREDVAAVYVPAWEGGHPDHDALHFVAANVMNEMGLLDKLFQFSLYNSYGFPKPFFRVMTPLKENGGVIEEAIPFGRRWKYVFNCLRYPSQLVSWVGLFPFVAFSYLFVGRQYVQPVSLARLQSRPHKGELYYEARGFANWEVIKKRLSVYE